MKMSIRTLAATAALLAVTMGPALAQESKPAATTAPAKTEAKPKAPHAAKAPAMTKDQYKQAQEALAKGGYYKGKVTGTWDKASATALKAWEKANKMPESGHLTADVLTKLTS
jgi:hypothetical protein